MFDLIKKTVYAGMGLALMTKEKAEEVAKKLVEEAKLSEAEGKKVVDEMLKKSAEAKESLEKTIKDTIEGTLKKLDLPSNKKIADLERRLAELEGKK
jgi:polyhydroxyalkanoate synthesis regulator phasin